MLKKNVLILLVLFMAACGFCGCHASESSTDSKAEILYEDVADISVFSRNIDVQIVQIPLLVNKELHTLTINGFQGENFQPAAIKFSSGFECEYQGCYLYIITLEFDPKAIAVSDADVYFSAIDLAIDETETVYHFGKAEIKNTVAENVNDFIGIQSLGLGYQTLDRLSFCIEANKDITVENIDTTSGYTINNEEKYLGLLPEGGLLSCELEVDSQSLNKLYYCFDLFVEYTSDQQPYTFYFTGSSIQTSMSSRLADFVNHRTENMTK